MSAPSRANVIGVKVNLVNVGIAGLGRFGSLHAQILSELPGVTIAAICDPDQSAREAAAARYGGAVTYGLFSDLLDHDGLDCVYVVTPEETHEEMVGLAISRGLPTFLEKPLALSASRGQAIVDQSRKAGVYLQVGFVLRYESRSMFLRDQISRGDFGRIATVRAKRNCSKAWFDVYGDRAHAVYETIIHDIDYLIWISGSRCTSVYALERNFTGKRFPDATMALLRFENGIAASLETSWLVQSGAPANVVTDSWAGTIDAELEVVGEYRSARLRSLESGLEIWTGERSFHPEFGLWPELNGSIGGALRAEDEDFINAVRTGVASSIASVEDAVHGLSVAEAITKSASSGGEVAVERN